MSCTRSPCFCRCAELVADPTVVNTALSNLETECTTGETGKCCESELTIGAFATIVTYHDLCDPSDVPEKVEKAFHDYEHGCEKHFCNMIGVRALLYVVCPRPLRFAKSPNRHAK